MALIILITTFLALYAGLRLQGGHGATISIKPAPAGSAMAKRARMIGVIGVVAGIGGMLFASFGTDLPKRQGYFLFGLFLVIAAGGLLFQIWRMSKKDVSIRDRADAKKPEKLGDR